MPQVVKYSTNPVDYAIKKGNMAIGVNSVDYGDGTWWNTIDVPSGGYVAYANKASNGPSIMVPQNDINLVGAARSFGASSSVTTAAGALNYFASQSDMIVVNKNYNNIVTSGLVLNLDASFVASYPVSGTSWYDVSGSGNTGILQNGPVYNTNGSILFDGVDDRVQMSQSVTASSWSVTSVFSMNFQKIKSTQNLVLTSSSVGFSPGSTLLQFSYSVTIYTIVSDSSGNIYIGGRITEYNGTVRVFIVKTDGSGNIDTTFNPSLTLISTQEVTDLGLDSLGNLYYVGYNLGNFTRISTTTGSQLQQVATVNASITQSNMVLDLMNDKVYIGGWFTSIQGTTAQKFARLNLSAMTIDTTFNTTTGFPTDDSVQAICLQTDGKILVGGQFTTYKSNSYNRIIRLNSDASIDTSFIIGTGFNNTIRRRCIQVQSDGKILVGGDFTAYSGVTRNRIIRLNSGGTIDDTFTIGTGFNSSVLSLHILSSSKIIVGGSYTAYSGVTRNRIIRLNSDGSIDNTFTIGTGFNNEVQSIHILNDGKIMVGGTFTTYSGITVNQICRLNADGTLDNTFNSGTGILGGYRLNCQTSYRDSANVATTNFFYAITDPLRYDWRNYETAISAFVGTQKFNSFTIVKSGNTYLQYWNGVYRQQTTYTNPVDVGVNINQIGSGAKGNIQYLYQYNRALSNSEILQNYYGGAILTTNLRQMWDAGNIISFLSGTTSTYDLVSDSVTGTTQNGVGFSNGYGGFWNFDGTDDRIILGSSITMGNGSTGWTISAWVKTTTNVNGLGQGTIISNQSGGPVYSQLCINSGKICYWVYKTSWVQYTGNTNVNTGNWVNLVWRNNASNTMNFFVNGNLDGTVSDSSIGGPTTNPLDSIGRSWTSTFAGDIALIMIHRAALTQNEIIQNFNAHRNRFGL